MRMLSNIVVVLIGIAFYFLLANWGQIHAGFGTFSSLIKPFVIGFAIAYLRRPLSIILNARFWCSWIAGRRSSV